MALSRAVFAFLSLAGALLCRAAEEESSGDGSEVADYRAHEEALARRPAKSVIDTNTVVRLGYELPDSVVVGAGAREKVYAKGLLAQCAIGSEKRFELRDGGALALGSAGFRFDSNYAKGRTNDVVFAGGAIAAFEPSYIRSAAPVRLAAIVNANAMQTTTIATATMPMAANPIRHALVSLAKLRLAGAANPSCSNPSSTNRSAKKARESAMIPVNSGAPAPAASSHQRSHAISTAISTVSITTAMA